MPTPDSKVVGPLGFEPRTDGLKVSGSSFKTAGKRRNDPGTTPERPRFQAANPGILD